jgi:hypothetical protein
MASPDAQDRDLCSIRANKRKVIEVSSTESSPVKSPNKKQRISKPYSPSCNKLLKRRRSEIIVKSEKKQKHKTRDVAVGPDIPDHDARRKEIAEVIRDAFGEEMECPLCRISLVLSDDSCYFYRSDFDVLRSSIL